MNRVVITEYEIRSSCGNTKKKILSKIKDYKTGIKNVKELEKYAFVSNKAGVLEKEFRNKIILQAEQEKIDESVSLAYDCLKSLVTKCKFTNEETENLQILLGTCNGNINSLEKYIMTNDESYLDMYKIDNYNVYFKEKLGISKNVKIFNSACSASGSALVYGINLIKSGTEEKILVGGVDWLSKYVYAGFNSLGALNSDYTIPYSDSFGLNLGEGCAFVCIESYESAIKRGATIIAELCGGGLSNDAYHKTTPHPKGIGVKSAIEEALNDCIDEINILKYVNAHGTGTNANDSVELAAILDLSKPVESISSYKSYIGHNLGAASIMELVIMLMGIEENTIIAGRKITEYRSRCNYQELLKQHQILDKSKTSYLLNTSSAFGGHNAAVILKVGSNCKDVHNFNDMNKLDVQISLEKECWTTMKKSVLDNKEEYKFDKDIKKPLMHYAPDLYERRMNILTQLSVISIERLLKDEQSQEEIALVFGTDLGSIESVQLYVQSILKNGINKASSLHFPDIVLNSTAGVVSKIFNLNKTSLSVSCMNIDEVDDYAKEIAKGNTNKTIITCFASEGTNYCHGKIENSNVKVVARLYKVNNEEKK